MALTRARYAALIVVSDPDGGTSPVTRAIIENADPRLTATSNPLEAWLEPVREAVPCPCCSPGGAGTGRLRLRGMSSRTRHFAGCTNWNGGAGCDYTQPCCGACGTGMLVEAPGGLFECSDPSRRSKQPGCRCRPPRPMVVRRQKRHGEAFLGLLAVRRGRRVRPHAAHRLNPGPPAEEARRGILRPCWRERVMLGTRNVRFGRPVGGAIPWSVAQGLVDRRRFNDPVEQPPDEGNDGHYKERAATASNMLDSSRGDAAGRRSRLSPGRGP